MSQLDTRARGARGDWWCQPAESRAPNHAVVMPAMARGHYASTECNGRDLIMISRSRPRGCRPCLPRTRPAARSHGRQQPVAKQADHQQQRSAPGRATDRRHTTCPKSPIGPTPEHILIAVGVNPRRRQRPQRPRQKIHRRVPARRVRRGRRGLDPARCELICWLVVLRRRRKKQEGHGPRRRRRQRSQ